MPNDKRIDNAIARAAKNKPKPLTEAEVTRLYDKDRKANSPPMIGSSPATRKIVRRTVGK